MAEDFITRLRKGNTEQPTAAAQAAPNQTTGATFIDRLKGGAPAVATAVPKRPNQGVGDFIGRLPTIAGTLADNLISGTNRREFDLPELPQFVTGAGVSGEQMAFAKGDIGKADILQQMLDANLSPELDQFGNVVVTITPEIATAIGEVEPGQYYVNRPGVSVQDAFDTGLSTILELIGAAGGIRTNTALRGGGLTRAIGAGAGAGLGSVAQDIGAMDRGSTEGIDVLAAGLTAVLGGVGEGVGQIIARRLMRPGSVQNGALTDGAKRALKTAGLTEDQISSITPELLAEFERMARSATDPSSLSNAAIVAQANTLPRPVPLTVGDITRDVTQQGTEDALEKGTFGNTGKTIMRDFRSRQNEALQGNAEAIQGRLSGADAPTVVNPTEGMDAIRNRLSVERGAAKDAVDAAYRAARAAPEAIFTDDTLGSLDNGLRALIAEQYGEMAPDGVVARVMGDLRKLIDAEPGEASLSGGAEATIRSLEEWKRRLNRQLGGLDPRSADAFILREIGRTYDGFLDEAFVSGMVDGSPEAIALWQNARRAASDFFDRWDGNKIVGEILRPIDETGELGLAITNEQALNLLFGASTVGARRGTLEAIAKLKRLLGAGSAEWNALREEAFLRLLRNQPTNNFREGIDLRQFSGNAFSTNWEKADKGVMRALFSQDEMNLMDQFRRVALAATNRVSGAVNPSGTANRLALIINRMVGNNIISQYGVNILDRFIRNQVGAGAASFATTTANRVPVDIGLRSLPGVAAGGALAGPLPGSVYGSGMNALLGEPERPEDR